MRSSAAEETEDVLRAEGHIAPIFTNTNADVCTARDSVEPLGGFGAFTKQIASMSATAKGKKPREETVIIHDDNEGEKDGDAGDGDEE